MLSRDTVGWEYSPPVKATSSAMAMQREDRRAGNKAIGDVFPVFKNGMSNFLSCRLIRTRNLVWALTPLNA